MGEKWGYYQNRYGLSDDEIYDLFNKPFLDDAIEEGLTIKFSHNPYDYDGVLRNELIYLESKGYEFSEITMTATPTN